MKYLKICILTLASLLHSAGLLAQYEIQTTNPPFTGNFRAVSCIDSEHGWACGDQGAIYQNPLIFSQVTTKSL